MDQAHASVIPLHGDQTPEQLGWRAVVGAADLEAPVEMHGPVAVLVVAKRLDREDAEVRLLLRKHRAHLTLRRAVDPRVRPVLFPPIEMDLGGFDRLETQAFQRRSLCVPDAGFHFPFSVRVIRPTGQGDHAIVPEDVAIQRVQRRVVPVRLEDTFAKIVEHHRLRRPAQPLKRAFVQLRPDLRARSHRQQPYGLPTVSEREHEKTRPSVLPRRCVPHHRSLAVVDLAFLARLSDDGRVGLGHFLSAQLDREEPDAVVAGRETMVRHQILVDRHRVPTQPQALLDQIPVRFAGTRRRSPTRLPRCTVGDHPLRGGRFWIFKVGDHLPRGGRFCRLCPRIRHRWPPRDPPTGPPNRDSRRMQIRASGLATDAQLAFNSPQRPSESPKRQYLFPFLFVQDVGHSRGGTTWPSSASTSRPFSVVAGFQVIIGGRVWVITEVSGRVFSKLTSRLSGRETLAMTHGELERLLDKEGRELIRQLLQDHLDLRGSGEVHGDVVGARDVRRPHARMRERKLETIFGTVTVTRTGYSAHDAETLFPRDAELNLPPELYSHGVQRRAADEVIKTSFDQAVMALASTTGAAVPKRQIEELAGRAAEDFDAFYEGRSAESLREARRTGEILALQTDAKGIVMRRADLREATRKAAAERTHKLQKRLSRGEKRNCKRMAQVAAVFTIAAFIRKPEDIVTESVNAFETARMRNL